MSFRAFLERKKKTDQAAAKLLEAMGSLQERLADRLATLLSQLDIKAGSLVPGEANANRIGEIISILHQQLNDDPWTEAVADYVENYDAITENVLKYGRTLGRLDDGFLSALKRQFKIISAEYLTSAASFNLELWIPLAEQIGGAIISGAPLADFTVTAKLLITGGDDADGALVGKASTTVTDLASIFERSSTQLIADELEVDFFLYQGSEIDTTREFCLERLGKAWHREEIEQWGDEEWSGRIPETTEDTIFSFLGGYNCRHVLLPLAEIDVPEPDLARMKAKELI